MAGAETSRRKSLVLYPDDEACLKWLKSRYGIKTDSQAMRLLLRLWRDLVEADIVADDSAMVELQLWRSHSRHGPSGNYLNHRKS